MAELWVKFHLGPNEDYSPGDSISDNSEKLLQRHRGKVSIHIILVKWGKCHQVCIYIYCRRFLLVAQLVKNLPAMLETWVRFLDWKDPLEGNGNPLQCSCLKNPMDRGAWQVTVHGVARVRHNLALSFFFLFVSHKEQSSPWRILLLF